MRLKLVTRMGLVLRVLSALVFLCFVSVSPSNGNARELTPSEISQYMLPDGSLPSLCVTIPGSAGQGKIVKLASSTIGLCKVVALTPPVALASSPLAFARSSMLPADVPPLRHLLYPPGSGPRAPPISV